MSATLSSWRNWQHKRKGYEAKLIVFNIWKVWIIFSLATMQVTSWLCFHLLATEKNNPAAWNLPYYWCKSHLKKSTFGNWPPHGWLLADTHHSIYNPISNWIQASLGSYSQLRVWPRGPFCVISTHTSVVDTLLEHWMLVSQFFISPSKEWAIYQTLPNWLFAAKEWIQEHFNMQGWSQFSSLSCAKTLNQHCDINLAFGKFV